MKKKSQNFFYILNLYKSNNKIYLYKFKIKKKKLIKNVYFFKSKGHSDQDEKIDASKFLFNFIKFQEKKFILNNSTRKYYEY